jgi:hypothetical protein
LIISNMGLFSGIASAVVGGLSSLAGGLLTNKASADQAQNAMNFSAQQTREQMDFQERMRETQYQTAVKDLAAAGLNPMLAYTQGGAGTPSGGAAVGQQATLRNPAEGLASSAYQLGMVRAEQDKKEAETVESISRTGVNDEQRKLINAQTILAILEAPNVSQRTKNLAAEELLTNARTTATTAQETATRLDTMIRTFGDLPYERERGKFHKDIGQIHFYNKELGQATSSAASAVNAVKGLANPFRIETQQPQPPKFRR